MIMTALADLTVQAREQLQILPLVLGAATSGMGYLLLEYLRRQAAEDYLREEATGQLAVASLLAVIAASAWVVLDPSLQASSHEIIVAGRKLAVPIMGALLLIAGWRSGKFDTPEGAAKWVASRSDGTRQVALVAALVGTGGIIFQVNVLDLYLLAFPATGLLIIAVWPQAIEQEEI